MERKKYFATLFATFGRDKISIAPLVIGFGSVLPTVRSIQKYVDILHSFMLFSRSHFPWTTTRSPTPPQGNNRNACSSPYLIQIQIRSGRILSVPSCSVARDFEYLNFEIRSRLINRRWWLTHTERRPHEHKRSSEPLSANCLWNSRSIVAGAVFQIYPLPRSTIVPEHDLL